MALERDWDEAHLKALEGCRHCGAPAEAAHILGRKYDKPRRPGLKGLWVNPLHIVPLCPGLHRRYDDHEYDILPLLTFEEQAEAVRLVGIVAAYRRITSTRGEPDGEEDLKASTEDPAGSEWGAYGPF